LAERISAFDIKKEAEWNLNPKNDRL
jgi:hypothetical protein